MTAGERAAKTLFDEHAVSVSPRSENRQRMDEVGHLGAQRPPDGHVVGVDVRVRVDRN
jgi:hypothetical protein